MFYSEYSGVVPDIQIMAKGIAGKSFSHRLHSPAHRAFIGGMPLSAIVAKNEFMKNQKPGSMGGTYCTFRHCVCLTEDLHAVAAGNALACAASAAIMDVFEQEKILDNVNARYDRGSPSATSAYTYAGRSNCSIH